MKTLKMIHYRKEQERKLKAINDFLHMVDEFDHETYQYYDPYTGFIQDKFLEDKQLVETLEIKAKEINETLVVLTNPLPEESEKWFWLENDGEKRLK